MSRECQPKIVVLGMMTKMPVAGVVWQNLHYLLGFRQLGFDIYYVESHARVPSMLMTHEREDSAALAAAFIDVMLRPFDLGDKWAYVALHDHGRCYGMTERDLKRLYSSAAMIVNLHGATVITPELAATNRLVYLETDPVQLQLELADDLQETIDFLEPHSAFFTFAECLGRSGCRLPLSERYQFYPTRQPVDCALWATEALPSSECFTTVGNWHQEWRDVTFQGERYTWSKSDEFAKVIDLPRRTTAQFELALSSYTPADRALLERQGWRIRPGMSISTDPGTYRRYVRNSVGEFTVAKDQNVRFRTGWFSDRSATYLAAGRPVVMQDTGFSDVLPTGEGLFPFNDVDEAVAAVEAIRADYRRHSAAAREIAVEIFGAARVLSEIVDVLGLSPTVSSQVGGRLCFPFADELVLEPISRWPTTLAAETTETVLAQPLPRPMPAPLGAPLATIIVATRDNLGFLRLCLESLLADPGWATREIIVVDNNSQDGTPEYLNELRLRRRQLRVISLDENAGFARAINRGLAAGIADRFVLLNDDTIVPPGVLDRLLAHLDDPSVGIVAASTNRSGDEAEVPARYRTLGELMRFAESFAADNAPQVIEVQTAALFCGAVRRDVYELCGDLDESFGLGLFEDDDYSLRVRDRGYRITVATDAFVHHFGQASIGRLAATEEYGQLFHANKARFERKWNTVWHPHRRRQNEEYEALVQRIHSLIAASVPDGATVAIITGGDDGLLDLAGFDVRHFPADARGEYVGYHPADSEGALAALDQARVGGATYLVVPRESYWWLSHYEAFADTLRERFPVIASHEDACILFELGDDGVGAQPARSAEFVGMERA